MDSRERAEELARSTARRYYIGTAGTREGMRSVEELRDIVKAAGGHRVTIGIGPTHHECVTFGLHPSRPRAATSTLASILYAVEGPHGEHVERVYRKTW